MNTYFTRPRGPASADFVARQIRDRISLFNQDKEQKNTEFYISRHTLKKISGRHRLKEGFLRDLTKELLVYDWCFDWLEDETYLLITRDSLSSYRVEKPYNNNLGYYSPDSWKIRDFCFYCINYEKLSFDILCRSQLWSQRTIEWLSDDFTESED